MGAKRAISFTIQTCVSCRKLQGRAQQIVATLPADHLQVDPPFTHAGHDVIIPLEVVARDTKGRQAKRRRWAALLACLSTRAVHIEVTETTCASCFIDAFCKFFTIRGPAKQHCSDCGTNRISASKGLKLDLPFA